MSLGTINQAAAAAALQAELETLNREWARTIDLFENERPHPATKFPDRLPLDDAVKRLAGIQGERARARASFAEIGEPTPEAPDPAAEIWDAIDATGRLGELRGHLVHEWRSMVRNALDGLDGREGTIDRLSKSGGGSEALAALRKAMDERGELAARLEALAYDPGQKQRRVDAALEAAGGLQALTDCARSALQYLERFEAAGETEAAQEAVAELEAAVKRIDPKTPLGQALKARLTEAKAAAKEARARAAGQAEADLSDLIDRAARADDGALEALAGLAGEVPDAFPAGFSKALAALDDVTEEQLRGCLAVIVADHTPD